MKKIFAILLLILIFNSKVYTQCEYADFSDAPKELFRKRVKEEGMRYGNPYTMFVKGDDFNLDNAITSIVHNLKSGIPPIGGDRFFKQNSYADLYKSIWKNAISAEPSKCAENAECPHPAWVKNNAVIYIVGLKYDTTSMGKDTFKLMSTYDRNEFAENAKRGLRNLNPNVISCWGGSDCGKVHLKAAQLVQYLQAYDLLKAGGAIAPLDQDRNGQNCSTCLFVGPFSWGLECTPRNKLRQFARNLYKQSNDIINSSMGWKKNHGIICASALGMAAIVLNDAGTETSFLVGVWGSIWNFLGGEAEVEYAPNYSPRNWYERAHGTDGGTVLWFGEDGIEDNFFAGNHANMLGSVDVPQTNSDGTSGYAEGPGYFSYLAKLAWFPYLRAADNFLPTANDKNYLAQQKYKNILKWYVSIQNQDHKLPSYDNTSLDNGNFIGVLGSNSEYNYKSNADFIPVDNYDLRGDYILAMGAGIVNKPESPYHSENSGNIVLRNENTISKQTFHMLCEKGAAIDKEAYNFINLQRDGTHEDDDMGSFMIYAGDKDLASIPLAVDAPYFSSKESDYTNKYWMHNTIEIDDSEPSKDREYINPNYTLLENNPTINDKNGIQSFDLTYDYHSTSRTANYASNAIKRNVNAIKSDDNLYYLINDYVDVSDIALTVNYIQLNLNGNGNKDINDSFPSYIGLKTYRKEKSGDSLYRWTYPCDMHKWSLTAHISALNNNVSGKGYWEDYPTENPISFPLALNFSNSTRGKDVSGNYHTRLRIHQPVKKTIFQSFLYPQKCDAPLPTVTKEETADHVVTKILFVNSVDTLEHRAMLAKNAPLNPSTTAQDTVSHFHYARWASNSLDSVRNPFNLPYQDSVWLRTNAEKAFVKHNTIGINLEGYKYCPPTHANLRHASFSNGTLLQIDTLKLIEASAVVSASLSFAGRYYYTGYVDPLSHSGSIKFNLPDVGRGVDMMAMHGGDTLAATYDSLTNTLSMDLPNDKTTFIIQQKQQCADCYFPPASINVVDTFNADDGQTHTLGHKLKVLPNNGNLTVSNGSRIFMCEGVYLRNKNNIVIESECQTKDGSYKICDDIKIDTSLAHSKNSAIVISAGSALVLDANSHTYIKNGGAIYVKRNGTLFIKNDAFVQIGDSGTCSSNTGWGEIVAEDGAYINIQDNAHIEFRRTIGDTVDRNLFYIPRFNPMGIALAGNYPFIHYVMYQDTIVPDSNFSYARAICDIATLNPIKNKEWGFSNIMTPRPFMRMRSDTLCPGEPLYIDLKRFLNDNSFKFKVCRMDSVYIKDLHNVYSWVDTCIVDTMSHDSILPDPVCVPPHSAPDYLLYYFKTNSLHRVTMEVANDCGVRVDTTAYVFVMDTPKVSISMPSVICEGVGTATVSITKLNRFPIKSYTFEITEIPDTAYMKVRKGITQTFTRTYYDTLPNTYNFDDYYFKSGRRYSISLTVTSACGGETFYTETSVPLAAKIVAGKPTAYAEPIAGATSVKLQGYIHAADSFAWLPHDWLNRTDTLSIISTPHGSISYTLSAYKGACVARDTISIRYNELSNIGTNDTLCYNHNTIALGNHYNAAMFLGWLHFYGVVDVNVQLRQIIANLNNDGIYLDQYLKYFNSYMFTDRFKESQDTSCFAYYDLFKNNETYPWEKIFNDSQFVTYYNNYIHYIEQELIDTSLAETKINRFKHFIDGAGFRKDLENFPIVSSMDKCFKYLFTNYESYLRGIYDETYLPMNVNWSKVVAQDTSGIDWENEYVAIVSPTKTTTYIQQALFPYGEVSIDSKTVFIDTAFTPLFYPTMQWDSSAYFTNASSPSSSTNKYLWDFGDGSATSTDVNPFHTFPAFNTHYVVCLTATNHCGNYTYCDTVWIDSLHLGGSFKVAAVKQPERNEVFQNISSTNHQPIANNCQLSNYPNPFDQSTIIDYEIWQKYSKAELRITNVLGQEVYIQRLNRPMDKVQIDGSALHDGLYYYSLIVDGAVKLTKTMSVIR